MSNDIYFGDCLEDMKLLPDHSVDMILCDLPYGTTQNKWDSVLSLDALWSEYRRIAKPNAAIVLTAAQPFTAQLVMSGIEFFLYQWVWEKSSVTGHLNAHKRPMRIHEDVCVFSFGTPIYNPQGLLPFNKITKRGNNGTNFNKSATENFQEFTNYPRSILRISNDPKPVHPTQKPVALFEYLIKTYTNEGDIVLDNCAGSGTTGVACINTGRKYILMEKERKYLDIIYDRLEIKEESDAVS